MDPNAGPADLWNSGLPIGLDARGTVARIAVTDTPFVAIVGRPGAGKTFAFFGIGACAAADPLWDLDAWAFKTSGSFRPLEPLVRAGGGTFDYGADPATYGRFYDYLVRKKAELNERNAILDRLPIEDNPNEKVERNVALRIRALRPCIVLADEILTAIEGDPRILPELEELARTARSQHIVFVLGAQFADSDTFKKLQKLLGARVVLSTARHNDTETALGGDHIPGVTDAHRIPLSAVGVGFLGGAVEDPDDPGRPAFKIRTFNTDRTMLDAHVKRCLTEFRAGQVPAAGAVVLEKGLGSEAVAWREKVAAVFEPGETVLTLTVLAERLGYGTGPSAAKALATDARSIGQVEPQRDTSGGKATGQRGVLFLALDQLTTDGA